MKSKTGVASNGRRGKKVDGNLEWAEFKLRRRTTYSAHALIWAVIIYGMVMITLAAIGKVAVIDTSLAPIISAAAGWIGKWLLDVLKSAKK